MSSFEVNKNNCKSFAKLLVSLVLALFALNIYDTKRIQADDFALGKKNTSRSEENNGVPFTGHTIAHIKNIVEYYSQISNKEKIVLWVGNSQLHTINQYKKGEHLAPYWMLKNMQPLKRFIPLGLSLSNANPQELFVLLQYVKLKLPLSAVILQIEFMGFREDGLRQEFSQILYRELVDNLSAYPMGNKFNNDLDSIYKNSQHDFQTSTQKSVKKDVESILSDRLASKWSLWKNRGNLRANVFADLFNLRNWLFNIKSSSQREIIKPRFENNMKALSNLLAQSDPQKMPIIMYIAPLRHDKPLPYSNKDYSYWKYQVEMSAAANSITFLNFEKLIPGQNWGSNFGEDIDFMHFKETGHKILASKLLPVVLKEIK